MWPGALRRNHDNVNICRRYDLLEVNVEAMRKRQHIARLEVRLNNFLIDVCLLFVRHQHHDDVASRSSLSHGHNRNAVVLGLLLMLGAGTQTDNNVHARILQVHGMRVALRAEAQNGNSLTVQQGQVAVRIIEHLYHF